MLICEVCRLRVIRILSDYSGSRFRTIFSDKSIAVKTESEKVFPFLRSYLTLNLHLRNVRSGSTFTGIVANRKEEHRMQNFELFCSQFFSRIEEKFSADLSENNFRLKATVSDNSTFLRDFTTELYLPKNCTKNSILLISILSNFIEFRSFQIDLQDIIWKRFFNPRLFYLDEGKECVRVWKCDDRDIIADSLRVKNYSARKAAEGGENPLFIHNLGVSLGSMHILSDFDFLQLCFLLTRTDHLPSQNLKAFLRLVQQSHLENWLFGNILQRNNLIKKKNLFDFRRKDKSPAKKPQRKRGYTDKGNLRDQTVPRPVASPYSSEEINSLTDIKKSTMGYLRFLSQQLDNEIEIPNHLNFEIERNQNVWKKRLKQNQNN